MTRDEYHAKLAQLRKSKEYKDWSKEQDEIIQQLKADPETFDPGEVADEPNFD